MNSGLFREGVPAMADVADVINTGVRADHNLPADETELCELVVSLYPELRRIAGAHMRRERMDHTWQPTALVSEAFMKLARLEGIIPALESSHAIAECIVQAPKLGKDKVIIVNLSGRGDKDVAQAADKIGLQMPK